MQEILVDPSRCIACRSCELWCATNRDSVSRSITGAAKEETKPISRVIIQGDEKLSVAMQCRHCNTAPCIDACPSGAMSRDEKTQTVYVQEDKCLGCWSCILVCPFGIIKTSRAAKIVVKCDKCKDMTYPYCVEACPTKALIYADPEKLEEISTKKSHGVIEMILSSPDEAKSGEKKTHMKLDFSR